MGRNLPKIFGLTSSASGLRGRYNLNFHALVQVRIINRLQMFSETLFTDQKGIHKKHNMVPLVPGRLFLVGMAVRSPVVQEGAL